MKKFMYLILIAFIYSGIVEAQQRKYSPKKSASHKTPKRHFAKKEDSLTPKTIVTQKSEEADFVAGWILDPMLSQKSVPTSPANVSPKEATAYFKTAKKYLKKLAKESFNPGIFGFGLAMTGSEKASSVFDFLTKTVTKPAYANNLQTLLTKHQNQLLRANRYLNYNILKVLQEYRFITYRRTSKVQLIDTSIVQKNNLRTVWNNLTDIQKKELLDLSSIIFNKLNSTLTLLITYIEETSKDEKNTNNIFALCNILAGVIIASNNIAVSVIGEKIKNIPKYKVIANSLDQTIRRSKSLFVSLSKEYDFASIVKSKISKENRRNQIVTLSTITPLVFLLIALNVHPLTALSGLIPTVQNPADNSIEHDEGN